MISAKFAQFNHELGSLLFCYPPFVMGRSAAPLVPGDVPVFVFHTIEPERFERQLKHLATGGYRTVGLEEFMGLRSGRLRGTGREVLLTIDDARSSVWRYGFPLLRKYQARAALFVITGWTTEGVARPNLDEHFSNEMVRSDLHAIDPDDRTVCNWEELRRMQDSGLVDVESHSHLHRRVFVGRKLAGVITETSVRTASDAEFSPYLSPQLDPPGLPANHFLGYPLFATKPLLGAPPMFEVASEAAAAFSAEFRKLGREVSRGGLRRLRRLLPESAFRHLDEGEVKAAIREDLSASQQSLRTGLRDSGSGTHLCLPFTVGSRITVGVARSLGFESIFWGVNRHRRSNPPGSDPMHLVRLKNDFVWRLPGVGRTSLARIYLDKASRRLAGTVPY